MLKSLTLKELGARINSTDELLMMLLSHRMGLSLNVGALKLATGEPIFRPEAEEGRLEKARELANEFGISPNFAYSLLYTIIGESCKQQMIQLQGRPYDRPPDVKTDEEWHRILKQNLVQLTERVAPIYDEKYGSEFFASAAYKAFESSVLMQEVEKLSSKELLVDLGCATGSKTLQLAPSFKSVVGYDLSRHMVKRANLKVAEEDKKKIRFQQADLEDGIPLDKDSASFVMMNLGTAGDMPKISDVIKDVHRVLQAGGRFLFSFYNSDALVYRWEFLPWPFSLAAEINHNKDCLDVHAGADIFSIYAKAYTMQEVESFFPEGMLLNTKVTYPTLSPILPNCIFKIEKEKEAVLTIDRLLADSGMGAYIIVTGSKN